MLSDTGIFNAIGNREIGIEPFDRWSVQPASVDLTLSNSFRLFNDSIIIDPSLRQGKLTSPRVAEDMILYPGEFVLASTAETIWLGRMHSAQLGGKSSLARIGLMIHVTAGFVDPGFNGKLTLELSNVGNNPIMLRAGMKICQISFTALSSPCMNLYGTGWLNSKYQGQYDATESRYYLNRNHAKREDGIDWFGSNEPGKIIDTTA